MAQLQQPFNAQQFDPSQGGFFQQLPKGKYPVIAVASEIKATSSGSGGMVVFQLQGIDGVGKGAEGNWMINLYNSSDQARSIAERQLSALCHVTGVFMLTDTSQLHNIPFVVEVEERPLTSEQLQKQGEGKTVTPFTQVKKVFDINGNEPGHTAPAQQSAPAPAQAAPAAPQAAQWAAPAATPSPAPAAAPAPAWGQPAAAAPAPAAWAPAGGAAGKPAWAKG